MSANDISHLGVADPLSIACIALLVTLAAVALGGRPSSRPIPRLPLALVAIAGFLGWMTVPASVLYGGYTFVCGFAYFLCVLLWAWMLRAPRTTVDEGEDEDDDDGGGTAVDDDDHHGGGHDGAPTPDIDWDRWESEFSTPHEHEREPAVV